MVTDLGALDELEDRSLGLRRVGKRDVGLVRIGDKVVVIRNACPHEGGPICLGVLSPAISGQLDGSALAGVFTDPDRLVLACPWHGWEFDLATGAALTDPGLHIKTYPTRIAAGRVLVDIPD